MRILVDTNVLISSMIARGKPYAFVYKLLRSQNDLILSKPLVQEFLRVSSDSKIRRYVTAEDVAKFLRTVMAKAAMVEISSKFTILKSEDDVVLQTAYDGGADLIVTGDRHLLELKQFRGIRILRVSEAILSV